MIVDLGEQEQRDERVVFIGELLKEFEEKNELVK